MPLPEQQEAGKRPLPKFPLFIHNLLEDDDKEDLDTQK